MRNNVLQNSQTIDIGGVDFTISGIAGNGSCCVVYRALRANDKSKWLIKEFYPDGYEFTRDIETHQINYSNDVKSELDRFSKTVEIMTKIYNDVDRNDTSPEDSCSCNCTGYVVIPQLEGKTLEEYDPEDGLKALFTQVLLVSNKLKKYHSEKYLYLDIKPENIFCCNGDSSRVQIIDFDSVIEEDARDDNVTIRCSNDWAAPELITGKRDKISAATDVYAVGEMLYYKLTGEHSDIMERTMHGNHDLSKSELLKGANPTLLNKLAEFFRRTLCSAPSARYSDKELIEALKDLIELSREPYIIGKRWGVPECFVGRDEDLQTAHDMLADKKYLFIQGFGGIGKSAFAECFAEVYHDEYDIILRTKSNDPINEIELGNYGESKFDNDNSEEEKRVQKWAAIQKACGRSNVLMIFDSSEKIDDSIICDELITLPCNKLFPTRRTYWRERGRKCFELNALSMEDSLKLFNYFCPIDKDSEGAAKQIIEELHRHTLAIKLAALAIKKRRYKGNIDSFVGNIKTSKVKIIGDDDDMERTFYGHIKVLFDVCELTKEEIHVLACLSLLPESGISKRYLDEDAEFDLGVDIDIVESLVDSGWIQENGNYGEMISLHPLIAEVAEEELYNDRSRCCGFLKGLSDYTDNASDMVHVISGVAEKLMNGRAADSKNRFLLSSLEPKEFLLGMAVFLKKSCKAYGGHDSQIKRLERATICYMYANENREAIKTAIELLKEYEQRPFHWESVDDDFLDCLNVMYEKLPHTRENQSLFEDLFRLAFQRFGIEGDETKVQEMFEKLKSCLYETDEAYAEMQACSICGGLFARFNHSLSLKYYERCIEYCQRNGIDDWRYAELCELRDSVRCPIDSNSLIPTPFNIKERSFDIKEKPIKDQIEISKKERNVSNRACMFIYTADRAMRNNSFDDALKCLEEAKKALESDISTNLEAIKLLNQGISQLRDPTNDSAETTRLLGTLMWDYKLRLGFDSWSKLCIPPELPPSVHEPMKP